MIERLRDTPGTSWFMEFNGRFYGFSRTGSSVWPWHTQLAAKKPAIFRTFTRSDAPCAYIFRKSWSRSPTPARKRNLHGGIQRTGSRNIVTARLVMSELPGDFLFPFPNAQ